MGKKAFKRGLIIGRFAPIQLGHNNLITIGLELCESTLVLVGSAQESGTLRNPYDLEPTFFIKFTIVYEFPTIAEIKAYVKDQLENKAWESELRSSNPHIHYVDMTERVYKTRQELYHKLHELTK